jgi:hypothetical protein
MRAARRPVLGQSRESYSALPARQLLQPSPSASTITPKAATASTTIARPTIVLRPNGLVQALDQPIVRASTLAA